MGDIMPLGLDRSMYVIIAFGGLFCFIRLIGGERVTVIDCVATGTLPVTVYINTITIIIYPWMRSIGIVYILSLVACIIAMSVLDKYRTSERRYNIRKSIWRGLRYWAFLSFAVVIICIIVCRKKMDEIESQQYIWSLDDTCQTNDADIELKNLELSDFRYERFIKLSMDQRKYIVELLAHQTMLFLTDGAVEPEVECAANLYGVWGRRIMIRR